MNTYQTFRDDFFNKVANVFKPTFSLYFAIDSCGCVIALFLGLRHGPTLLSHDVVRKPIELSGTTFDEEERILSSLCFLFMLL